MKSLEAFCGHECTKRFRYGVFDMNHSFSTARKAAWSGHSAVKGRAGSNQAAGRFQARGFTRSPLPNILTVSWTTVSCSLLPTTVPKQGDLL